MRFLLQAIAIIISAGLLIFGFNRNDKVMAWSGVAIIALTLCTI